ncbi:hypothetical protein DPMN_135214 [Dreissena polymorpha]|uniref:Uncharacterized protein n=1 Tax=Dreissena polymorpha TaxID=45954 RepID=A0A9D4JBF3_DREPO|nr:hypothetical protein DPMN_135214 [Dreissena polymorpha]
MGFSKAANRYRTLQCNSPVTLFTGAILNSAWTGSFEYVQNPSKENQEDDLG